jgi:large subunit ribosomal protein L16
MQPVEKHMGSEKGSLKYWVFVVKPNKILYEVSGIPEIVAKAAMRIVIYKMPIRTQFVIVISDKNMSDG